MRWYIENQVRADCISPEKISFCQLNSGIQHALSPPLVQFRKEMNLCRKHCCLPALECASIGFASVIRITRFLCSDRPRPTTFQRVSDKL